MYKVSTKIDDVKLFWDQIKVPKILRYNFLEIYYNYNKNIKHLFVHDKHLRLYAHIFTLKFSKTNNYLDKFSISSFLLKFFSLDVLYLTNSFITNLPSFESSSSIHLSSILNSIKYNFSLIVIPDFLFVKMKIQDNDYTKIKVEEEMVLDINEQWICFDDYLNALKKKYRNKVKKIIRDSDFLVIRKLCENDFDKYKFEMRELFKQVVSSSQFSGPLFNTDAFNLFVKENYMRVDGYFLEDTLVAFSSEMQNGNNLCSYFVGFDKELNKTVPLYGRILIENIKTSIVLRKKRLIFGRTANEFKSNFGAFPIESFVYLKLKNKFLRFFLAPIYSRLTLKKWRQRSPFKS